MTRVRHDVAAPDIVLGAFGELGTEVDTAGGRSLPLDGPHVLWLVAGGSMDLFAVDAADGGRWHFVGRLEAGALLPGPVKGPPHTLVARPLPGCVLRRIYFRELMRPEHGHDHAYGYGYGYEQGTRWSPYRDDQAAPSPLEQAFAHGIGRSLRILYEAADLGSAAPPRTYQAAEDDILWMSVDPGALQYDPPFGEGGAWELLIDGSVWMRMVKQQSRLLSALGRRIEHLERAHEVRAAAGAEAAEAVREQADQALLASIGGPGKDPAAQTGRRGAGARERGDRGSIGRGDGNAGAGGDTTFEVCRRVAAAAGITVSAPAADGPADERTDPVERIALSSGFRTRTVALGERWWREDFGPLVGRRVDDAAPVALLWRRGRYEAVEPGSGERTAVTSVNAQEFARQAVMFYRPLPPPPVSAQRLLRFGLRGTRADQRSLLVGGLVAVGLGALVPIATGRVLGVYVPAARSSLIVQTSLALCVTTVVSAAFMLLQNISLLRIEGRLDATVQSAVWDRLLRLPTRFFAERSTGELASAAMGVSAIRQVVSGIASVTVQAGTVGLVNLVLLLNYSLPLALAALAVLSVNASVFLGLGLRQLRWQRRLVELDNELNNQAFQTLRGLPKLRVAAAESFAYAAWADKFARTRELQHRVGRIRNLITVFNAVYLPLCTFALFALLAGPARGSLSAAGFLTFNTSATLLLTSATQLTGALISAAAVLPMFEQLRPILAEAPEVPQGAAHPGSLEGGIEADRLSFRYAEAGPLVLDNVSLRVRPGEFVAIVGASGCGKSTLLRLLIGFDRPTVGSVLYDGKDLAALDQAAVRRQCGVVLQNAQPFAGSILDCIRGSESFTVEEAWKAAELAGLAQDIKRMPMQMHTVITDGGGAVSGGQRQRLVIARALIRRPRILFLDEATSALDNETQRIVIASTRRLRCTRIVIAHRLSTIVDADRVIVMAHGRIVEQGTPRQLLGNPAGALHELARRQME